MPDVVRIGHTIYSWTSTLHRFSGLPWEGIKSVDYSQKRERKVVHAARRDGRPLGKTSGKYTAELKIKMLKDSANALKQDLSALGLGSYGDAEFSYSLQVFEPQLLGTQLPIVVLFETCTIDEEHDAYEEGVEELLTEFTIGTLQITENLMRLWSVVRGIP